MIIIVLLVILHQFYKSNIEYKRLIISEISEILDEIPTLITTFNALEEIKECDHVCEFPMRFIGGLIIGKIDRLLFLEQEIPFLTQEEVEWLNKIRLSVSEKIKLIPEPR